MLNVLYDIKESIAVHETKLNNLEYRVEKLEDKSFYNN